MPDLPAFGPLLRPRSRLAPVLLLLAGLAGCGAEVAGSTASVGALQADARRIADAASATE